MKRTAMKPSTTPMKRTEFKSKPVTYIALRADRAASISMPVPKKPRRQKMDLGRNKVFRAPWLLALVRKLPCVVDGRWGLSQAAHSNQQIYGKGMSQKASDAATFPLCSSAGGGCHAAHDQGGYVSKQEWKALEDKWVCWTIRELIRRGWIVWEVEPDDLHLLAQDDESMAMYLVRKVETGQLKASK